MHAFEILGDPVRRRILELLAEKETSAGEIVSVIGRDFGISQSAVSQHLRILRDNGFATVRSHGTQRLYLVQKEPFQEIDEWLNKIKCFWTDKLNALDSEIERGKRIRKQKSSR